MKKYFLFALASLFLAISTITFADDDALPASSMPMSKILQNLQTKGMTVFYKVEFDDGFYKVVGLDATGNKVKLKINPTTGVEEKFAETKPVLSMLEAVKRVEANGYHGITKIEAEDKGYEIKVFDKDNHRVELKINNKGQLTVDKD